MHCKSGCSKIKTCFTWDAMSNADERKGLQQWGEGGLKNDFVDYSVRKKFI